MTDREPPDHTPFIHRRRRGPILLLAASALLALFFFGSIYFRDELSDSIFQFDFALVNIITAIGIGALLTGWLIWMWFFSRGGFGLARMLPLLIIAASAAGLVLFQPVFTGGMGISRWEPRFWDWRTLADIDGNLKTDLYSASPKDFSQFLGSHRNGIIENFSVPLDNFYKMERRYLQDVGNGWSGFVARNGFAITMEQRGDDECVVCYDIKTGAVAWSYRHARRHFDGLGRAGPRATPTLDENRVYAAGANGMLVCLDIDSGQLIWQQDLAELFNIPLTETTDSKGNSIQTEQSKVVWGRAASPLIVDELVVVPGGGPLEGDQVTLVAFNKLDGKEVWRGGEEGIGYASPVLVDLSGKRQIVTVNDANVSGHDPADGNVLWSYPWPGNSNADANTSQPVIAGPNRVLLSKGYGVGGELIEITVDGDEFEATSVWKNSRVLKTKLTSSIIYKDHVYALSDGILECVDLETGKRVWKKGRYGHGQLLLVGQKFLVHSEHGSLHLIEATPESFQELGELETISGVCWNYFCVFDRYILVRSDIEMACFKVGDEQ